MPISDDDRPKKRPAPQPGENLAELSVDELNARIILYQEEIERLQRDIEAKEKHRRVADSFFKR